MNVFTNGFVIFVFIFIALFLRFPVINERDALMNKVYLFAGVFALQVVLLSIDKIQDSKDCKTSTTDILKESAKIGLLSVVAYSVVIDLINIPAYRAYIERFLQDERYSYIFTSGAIGLQIAGFKLIDNFIFPRAC